LANQETVGFTYSVVVADNDSACSARPVVENCKTRSSLNILYAHESEQNISRARNTAVANATGDYVAFIDDDEYPESDWLRRLLEACWRFKADGVLGPVLPHYQGNPPAWLVRSGLCDRARFPSGTAISESRFLRAGNVLFVRDMLFGLDMPFDPRLGRTGGEDADFFHRMVAGGRLFVWCNEAPVHEEVPSDRQTLGYHVRRAFVRGVTEADRQPFWGVGTLKSMVALGTYALALPFLWLLGRHLFARYLVKTCDHAAKLLAHFGIRLAQARTF
jgi:glycosyltransferase involved in cell wall biosynthesis